LGAVRVRRRKVLHTWINEYTMVADLAGHSLEH